MQANAERRFMKPGKNNKEDRLNFVRFWADYIREHPDKECSEQQNFLINSQIRTAKNLIEVKETKKNS